MKKNNLLLVLLALSLSYTSTICFAKSATKQKPINRESSVREKVVLNDSWYLMQSGKSPWGYFHEFIEEKEGKYFYKYDMIKKEQELVYQENIGAIAELDLKPITMNLNKAGVGATEVINVNYARENNEDFLKIEITGARNSKFKRPLSKGVFIEVFMPIWIKNNWSKLKPLSKGKIKVFAEDPNIQDFLTRDVYYTVKSYNNKEACLEIDFILGNVPSSWCINEKGVLQWMDINHKQIMVKRAKSEAEAKAFLPK